MDTQMLNLMYTSHLAEVLTDADTWLIFQQFAGRHYKHSFANQVILHAQDPRATYIGTYKQWTSLAGRSIKTDAPQLTLYAGTANPFTPAAEMRWATVYDLANTQGTLDTLPRLYPLSPRQLDILTDHIDNRETIEDYDDFLGILLRKSARDTLGVLADSYPTGEIPELFDDEEFMADFILPAVAFQIEEHRSSKRSLSFIEIEPYLSLLREDLALAYAVGSWITHIHLEATLLLKEISDSLEYPLLGDALSELLLSSASVAIEAQNILSLPSPAEATEENLTKVLPAESTLSPQPSTAHAEQVTANLTKVNPENFTPSRQLPDIPPLPDHDLPDLVPSNFVIPVDFDQRGNQKQKFQQNIRAIQLLKELEREERAATTEEQLVLAKYAGWGGLPQAFDPLNPDWQSECTELALLLNEEEYRDARRSMSNAHYTSVEVIDAIYAALDRLGYQGDGNLLEPSMGVGNFFGRLPDQVSSSRLYGVELDSITGRIAQKLYPLADIQITGFESAELPDEGFDIAIGNVPFGNYTLFDPKYRNENFLIHDYFLAKAVDKLRPGGIMAFITSSGTLDKGDASCREYLAQRADLLGAIRLPSDTFTANAGTEVTTDILFYQKLPQKRKDLTGIPWIYTVHDDELGAEVNQYYLDNPRMLLGTLTLSKSMYGGDRVTLKPIQDGIKLADLLKTAIEQLPSGVYKPWQLQEENASERQRRTLPALLSVKPGGYAVVDGTIYQRDASVMYEIDSQSGSIADRIRGMTKVKVSMRRLIAAQLADCSDETLFALQADLKLIYDSFTVTFGFLNSKANRGAYAADPDVYLLTSLEREDQENPKTYLPGRAFSARTIVLSKPVERVATAQEALVVSIHETGRIDPSLMSRLLSYPAERITAELMREGEIFPVPQTSPQQWVTRSEYLSGNVRQKLAQVEAATGVDGHYQANVTALQAVIPADIPSEEIDLRLGATWVPPQIYQQFTAHLYALPIGAISLTFDEQESKYKLSIGREWKGSHAVFTADSRYGLSEWTAQKVIEHALNRTTAKVYVQRGERGGRVMDPEASAAATEKIDLVHTAFLDWVWQDASRREELVREYNRIFNSIALRTYDGSSLNLPGKTPEISLRKHQLDAVARILYSNHNTLLAHTVGSGKTYIMVSAIMELKRIGIAQKPMIIVPNHLVEQWGAEFLRLYPNASVLVATKEDFTAQKRQRLFARISTSDWDAVVIAHSSFARIPVSPEREKAFIETECNLLRESLTEARKDQSGNRSLKGIETQLVILETRLKILTDTPKDNAVSFDELGIDFLFVDEAHEYKNLAFRTRMGEMAGINAGGARKSTDLLMKIRCLSEGNETPRICFATGTPIANSVVEMYTMLRYLHTVRLAEMGLSNFDAWASVFGRVVTSFEITPDASSFRQMNRFASFHNIPELLSLFREIADVQTAAMLDLAKPDLLGGKATIIPVEGTPELKAFVESLATRAEAVRQRRVRPDEDNMLKITTEGRLAALDMRLVDPKATPNPTSKVAVAASNIYRIWGETKKNRGTQLVFCDLSTPKTGKEFSVYQDLRSKLNVWGIPIRDIAFIHDASTDEEREALFERVREGDIRILIGSTAKMGTGTNVQNNLIALHHLDVPWKPAEMEQRDGRILRQGNLNSAVTIYRYVTENSFDAYSYQILEAKANFIAQIMSNQALSRTLTDLDSTTLSYAEVKAIASGNELIRELYQVEQRVRELENSLIRYNSMIADHQRRIDESPRLIAGYENSLLALRKDMATYESHKNSAGDTFLITLGDRRINERAAAGELLYSVLSLARHNDHDFLNTPLPLGIYQGLHLYAIDDSTLELRGESVQRINLEGSSLGGIARIENAARGIARSLESVQTAYQDYLITLETSREMIVKPFEHSSELHDLKSRLQAIHAELDIGQREDRSAVGRETSASEERLVFPVKLYTSHDSAREMELQNLILKNAGYILSNRETLHRFVKVMGVLGASIYANTMLTTLQMPDGTHFESAENWQELYARGLRDGATPIHTLLEIKTTVEISGELRLSHKRVPVELYDVSQTNGALHWSKVIPRKGVTDRDLLIKALFSLFPDGADYTDDKISPLGFYDPLSKKAVIRDDLDRSRIAYGLIHAYAEYSVMRNSDSMQRHRIDFDRATAKPLAVAACSYYGLPDYDGGEYLTILRRKSQWDTENEKMLKLIHDNCNAFIASLQQLVLAYHQDVSRTITSPAPPRKEVGMSKREKAQGAALDDPLPAQLPPEPTSLQRTATAFAELRRRAAEDETKPTYAELCRVFADSIELNPDADIQDSYEAVPYLSAVNRRAVKDPRQSDRQKGGDFFA
ncbi:MAG: DEAD/DEAH box helicase family protein [Symbiobacteriaceae bacterium]|nr:DEAD/DEAH box helicase family protein [Symbiobacteriaceae bacterium]